MDIKEIRLSLNIDTNDFNTKVGQASQFLAKGDKVKVSIRFRGREMAHTDLGLSLRHISLTEEKCRELAGRESLLLVCGHYEGVDERVIDALADEEISIGDYVLTGGELAALVVADSVFRLCPGVLACPEGYEDESYYSGPVSYTHLENADLADVAGEEMLEHRVAERAGAAGDQQGLVLKNAGFHRSTSPKLPARVRGHSIVS